jgi:hypothetical protein
LAACGPDSFSRAKVRKFFTSSFDHAVTTRRFRFTIGVSSEIAHHTRDEPRARPFFSGPVGQFNDEFL